MAKSVMSESQSPSWLPTAGPSPRMRRQEIDLAIEPLEPISDWRTSETDKVLLFEQNGTNVAARYSVGFGDTDAIFASAEYTRREFFRAHRHTAVPMETRGVVAEWDETAGRLIVNGATKVTFFNRRALAAMMQMPESAIDLIELDVGGGFGVRGEFYPEDFLIPFAARKIKRPIKWIEDRLEHLQAANHSREIDCDLEIACSRDGTILALRGAHSRGHGRLHSHQFGCCPCQGRAIPAWALSHSSRQVRRLRLHDQQNTRGDIPFARALRSKFLPRAIDRHGGARSQDRSDRIPSQEF